MRLRRATCLALVLCGSAALAAPPATPAVRLPEPAKADPSPVFPGAVVKLTAETIYVIDSDVPCVVLASPEGLVSVTEEAGPVKIRGKFVGGGGKTETRTYKGKAVFSVEAVVSGRVELLVVPVGLAKAADVVRVTVDVEAGQAPQPPPAPKPDDDPNPKPQPNTLADAAWVVVVLETTAKTPELAKLLDPSGSLRAALVTRRIGYREYDKDSPDLKSKNYTQHAPASGVPFVLVLDRAGKVLRSVPATAAELDKIAKGQ